MTDKAAVFIDGGYFKKVTQELVGPLKVDIAKFSDLLCGNLERVWTFYYDCPPFQSDPPTEDEKRRKAGFDKFAYRLEENPRFRVRLGKLSRRDEVCSQCGFTRPAYKQKRVDNLITVDITRTVWKEQVYKIFLVTGDSDFVPAVEEANRAQVLTHIYYLKSAGSDIHDELYIACSERTMITKELLEKARL
jgi:uncharacterized LabA/DUF88 family protein